MGKTGGFTVESLKHRVLPTEDAYKTFSLNGRNILAVADGITRDPQAMDYLDLSSRLSQLRFVLGYPHPSPARAVADLFCTQFSSFAGEWGFDLSNVPEFMKGCNYLIGESNKEWITERGDQFDFLQYDYPACVAAGAIELNGQVNFGFIADCGVAILDEKGRLRFVTPNEGPNSKGSIDQDIARRFNTSFVSPLGRRIIRQQYRNNPKNPLSYGALTGQPEANVFIRSGQETLLPGEVLFVFTDGVEDLVRKGDLADIVKSKRFDQLESLCKAQVRSEGTLAYLAKD